MIIEESREKRTHLVILRCKKFVKREKLDSVFKTKFETKSFEKFVSSTIIDLLPSSHREH